MSGNPLCAAAYASLKLPFLLWLGTPWQEDRTDRVRTFPPALKLLDRRILRAPGGRILCIRHGTARALEAIAGQAMDGVLIRPVDGGPFQPKPERVQPWMIGFSGRYGAPPQAHHPAAGGGDPGLGPLRDSLPSGRTLHRGAGSPEAMAAAIPAVCGDRQRRQRLGAGARATIRDNWRQLYPGFPLPD